jgi:hypothetical protein
MHDIPYSVCAKSSKEKKETNRVVICNSLLHYKCMLWSSWRQQITQMNKE